MTINNSWKTAIIAIASSVATIAGYKALSDYKGDVIINEAPSKNGASLVNYDNIPAGQPGDFTFAAGVSAPALGKRGFRIGKPFGLKPDRQTPVCRNLGNPI